MSKRGNKKSRQEEDDQEEEEEEDERVLFFIPSAGIDIEVLVFYLKRFLGHDSDAEPGRHPKVRFSLAKDVDCKCEFADESQNRDVDGYFVRSRLGLSAVSCSLSNLASLRSDRSSKVMVGDLKRDSAAWKDEKRKKRTRSRYPLPIMIPQLTRSLKEPTRNRILPIVVWRAAQVGDPRFHQKLKNLLRNVEDLTRHKDNRRLGQITHKRQATSTVDRRILSCSQDPILCRTLKQTQ